MKGFTDDRQAQPEIAAAVPFYGECFYMVFGVIYIGKVVFVAVLAMLAGFIASAPPIDKLVMMARDADAVTTQEAPVLMRVGDRAVFMS